MEELMAHLPDGACSGILRDFSDSHRMGWQATGSKDHSQSYVRLQERRIPLLGKWQRFWDQGEAMFNLSDMLRVLGRKSEAATWEQRARDIGAANGFFSLESKACVGLGNLAFWMGATRKRRG